MPAAGFLAMRQRLAERGFLDTANRLTALGHRHAELIKADIAEQTRRNSGSAAERAYFDGDFCQHVADRDEHIRLRTARRAAEQAMSRASRGGFAGLRP